ncbi:MAG: hypothetical protein EZS28_024454, partial [Streblomastix strix]
MSSTLFDERAKEVMKEMLEMNALVGVMQIVRMEIHDEQQYYICNIWSPLDQITNCDGQAFGGAVFFLLTTAGWSLLSTILFKHRVVLQQTSVEYRKPISGPFLLSKCVIEKDCEENSKISKINNDFIWGKVNVQSKGYSVNSIGDDVDESLIEAESVANIKYHIDT